MNQELLEQLSKITPEEERILEGNEAVDRSIYYRDTKTDCQQTKGTRQSTLSEQNQIDATLLLEKGKLIDIRPNTRFLHFPEHSHNFVEFVYMCQGSTTHIIDGQEIRLEEGDLLFMNQHARQEILPAKRDDIAINFIIMPPFFDEVLRGIGDNTSTLTDFLISCLTEQDMGGNYLYFHASGILPVQNLMENLIWIMLEKPHGHRLLSQQTMVLLFLNLLSHMDQIVMPQDSYDQKLIMQLLTYINEDYKKATLTEFAEQCSLDIYSLGRFIKKHTGGTFKDLLMDRRLKQAAWLLSTTKLPIADVAVSVGYENTSFFYRIFKGKYGMSPRDYRLKGDEKLKHLKK